MFVRSSFLIVVVAFSVGKPTDVTFDNGDEAELEQMRRRGHGLGRCKLYRPPPAPTDECPAKDRIFFKVENFDRAFSRRCRDYIPQDNEDLQIDDIHEAIQDACEVEGADAFVRFCTLQKKATRNLLEDQEVDDFEDVDLEQVDLVDYRRGLKGRCYICPSTSTGNEVNNGNMINFSQN